MANEPVLTIENVRIVHGNPSEARDKINFRTKEKELDKETGQPIKEWVCGVAIPMAYFNSHVWPYLDSVARPFVGNGAYPNDFSWKIINGDTGVDPDGKPYNLREGYAGHMVMTIKTQAGQPNLWKGDGNGSYVRLQPGELKCGYWVDVAIAAAFNGNKLGDGAGIYINPKGFVLTKFDKEISTGSNPNELFGGKGHSAPQGAPISNAGAMPGIGGQPQGNGMPGQQPQQPAQYVNPPQPQMQPVQQPVQYAQQPQQPYNGQPGQQPGAGQLPTPAVDFVNQAVGQQQPVQYVQQPQNGFPQQPVNNGQPQGGFPGQTATR